MPKSVQASISALALSLLLAACAHDGTAPALMAGPAPCAPHAGLSDPLAWDEASFGCATAQNLRAMVADPADLEHGRELSPAAGDAAFQAIERHRAGQTKGMPDPTTPTPTLNINNTGGK
jgi:hypothetical protein